MVKSISGILKAKYGEDYYRRIGRKGGKKGGEGKGFASNKTDANGLTGAERAKLAGSKSKRVKKIEVKYID